MSQFTSPQEALQQTLQDLLQPGEQLLWSDYPQLRKLRPPLISRASLFDHLFGVILALLLTALFYWQVAINAHTLVPLWLNITLFFCIFLSLSLRLFLKRFTAALRNAPPYRRYTLYAITDRRILIIVRLPASQPTILEYLPHDIDLFTNRVPSHSSGILPFGPSRQSKSSYYGPTLTLPGSFVGISHVQEITALLQQLKSRAEPLAQDVIEQFSTDNLCSS